MPSVNRVKMRVGKVVKFNPESKARIMVQLIHPQPSVTIELSQLRQKPVWLRVALSLHTQNTIIRVEENLPAHTSSVLHLLKIVPETELTSPLAKSLRYQPFYRRFTVIFAPIYRYASAKCWFYAARIRIIIINQFHNCKLFRQIWISVQKTHFCVCKFGQKSKSLREWQCRVWTVPNSVSKSRPTKSSRRRRLRRMSWRRRSRNISRGIGGEIVSFEEKTFNHRCPRPTSEFYLKIVVCWNMFNLSNGPINILEIKAKFLFLYWAKTQ